MAITWNFGGQQWHFVAGLVAISILSANPQSCKTDGSDYHNNRNEIAWLFEPLDRESHHLEFCVQRVGSSGPKKIL